MLLFDGCIDSFELEYNLSLFVNLAVNRKNR